MATIDRYENDNPVQSGRILGTNSAIIRLRDGIDSGEVRTTIDILRGAQRLDILAHRQYGDGRLWWIIAAASGIGWWLQAPAGTRLVIPVDINEVRAVI
tara:strand:- start:15 stop:311 length:297 start_codon:yes stop_codon:yes gene_type:complete